MADDATSNAPTQSFLDVESAANELVAALENLRAEAENYSEATVRLDEAGGALITAAHAVKGLSEKIDAATQLMDGHAKRVDDAVQAAGALKADLDAGLSAQAKAMTDLHQALEGTRQSVNDDAAAIIKEHEARMDAAENSLGTALEQMEAKLAASADASKQEMKSVLEESTKSVATAVAGLKTSLDGAVGQIDGKLQEQGSTLGRLSSRVSLAVMLAGGAVILAAGALIAVLVK